jgi:hypothetical protein
VANRTPAVPAAAATWPVVSTPAQAAAGRLAYGTAQTTSQVIISGRMGSRSTHAPAGKPITSQGR